MFYCILVLTEQVIIHYITNILCTNTTLWIYRHYTVNTVLGSSKQKPVHVSRQSRMSLLYTSVDLIGYIFNWPLTNQVNKC